MAVARAVAVAACIVALCARAADDPIPLRPRVVLDYVHHNFDSPQDRQVYVEIESVTPDGITFGQDVHSEGGKVERYRQVMTPAEMARSKTLAFGWGCAGQAVEAEATRGSSRFMASQRLLRLLKEQDDVEIASFYIDGCSPPRPIGGPVGSVGPVERLRVLVNGDSREIPAVHARGRMTRAFEGIDWEFDWWFLDHPDHPWLLGVMGTDVASKRTYRFQLAMVLVPDDAAMGALEAALQGNCEATVYGITFATGSAELTSAARATLDDVAAVLRKHPDWKLTVQGHTDNIGGEKSNQDLSERRARAVKDALVQSRGIPATALDTRGFGLTRPVDTNDTIEGRARNRRVQLIRSCRRQG